MDTIAHPFSAHDAPEQAELWSGQDVCCCYVPLEHGNWASFCVCPANYCRTVSPWQNWSILLDVMRTDIDSVVNWK